MKKKEKKAADPDSGIRPQDLDDSVLDEPEDGQGPEYNVQFLKLITGEEIVALVDIMMTFESHNTEPTTTFLLSYPMEVVNMSLNGEHNVIFKPWINQILATQSIPLKERMIMANVELRGRLKVNFLKYVAAKQTEKMMGDKVETEATFH